MYLKVLDTFKQASRSIHTLDNAIDGNLTEEKRSDEETVEGKINKLINLMRTMIAEVYGVSRIAESTGIYLLKDIDTVS